MTAREAKELRIWCEAERGRKSKYCDHLPLFRQSAMLERETGLELSRVTLCGWVTAVGELLMAIVGAMRRELLSVGYIQADERPSMCNPNEPRARITRLISGNIADLADR